MAQSTEEGPPLNVLPLLEDMGLRDVLLDQIGLHRIIEAVGAQKVLDEIGTQKVLDEIGTQKVLKTLGLDKLLAGLDTADRQEVLRRLQAEGAAAKPGQGEP